MRDGDGEKTRAGNSAAARRVSFMSVLIATALPDLSEQKIQRRARPFGVRETLISPSPTNQRERLHKSPRDAFHDRQSGKQIQDAAQHEQ